MNKMEVDGSAGLLDEGRPKWRCRPTALPAIGLSVVGAFLLVFLAAVLGGGSGKAGSAHPSAETPGAKASLPQPPPVGDIPCNPNSWQPDAAAHGFIADCSQCAPATQAKTGGRRAREGGCDTTIGPVAKGQKCLIVQRSAGLVGGEVVCDSAGVYRITPATTTDAVRTCAPSAIATPSRSPITKIAFGSCAWEHEESQPILGTAVSHEPQLFVYLGDNVYGDTISIDDLQMKYAKLAVHQHEQGMCEWVARGGRLLQTWDDHDRGENDCGKYFEMSQQSREVFMDFWRVPASSPRRTRADGVFTSDLFGEGQYQVQVITLDTRSFRDNITRVSDVDPGCSWVLGPGNDGCSLPCYSSDGKYNSLEGPCKNDYVPNEVPVAAGGPTMLGEQQWEWLEEQLRVIGPKLRVIASSVQFAIEYNGWEGWANLPQEQKRMIDLIRRLHSQDTNQANGVIFVSGDVHYSEISKLQPDGLYPLYDVTSSGITQVWADIEQNRNRVGNANSRNNFGVLELDWGSDSEHLMMNTKVRMVLRDVDDQVLTNHTILLRELSL